MAAGLEPATSLSYSKSSTKYQLSYQGSEMVFVKLLLYHVCLMGHCSIFETQSNMDDLMGLHFTCIHCMDWFPATRLFRKSISKKYILIFIGCW